MFDLSKTLFSVSFFLSTLLNLQSMGQSWVEVGQGFDQNVYDLVAWDGVICELGGNVTCWDGTDWFSLPNLWGVSALTGLNYQGDLIVAGDFTIGSTSRVMRFDGSTWNPVGGVFDDPEWASSKTIFEFDGDLIAGGNFTWVEGNPANNVARWNGTSWEAMGDGLDGIVKRFTDWNGNLVASGGFYSSGGDSSIQGISLWNGQSWEPLDSTHQFTFSSGPIIGFGSDLIITSLDTVAGVPMNGIASWDGNGLTSLVTDGFVYPRRFWVVNDNLYCSGWKRVQGEIVHSGVLKYSQNYWVPVGDPFNNWVLAIETFEEKLFAGGFFTQPVRKIAMLEENVGIEDPITDSINSYVTFDERQIHLSKELFDFEKTVILTDLFGRAVYRDRGKPNESLNIDLFDATTGIYCLMVGGDYLKVYIK